MDGLPAHRCRSSWLFLSLLLPVSGTKVCRWAALASLREATEQRRLCAIWRAAITMCVSSCSLAVSGSPPVGLDADSWLSILLSSKRKSSISLWKPWAFWEKDISTVSVSKCKSNLLEWSWAYWEESEAAPRHSSYIISGLAQSACLWQKSNYNTVLMPNTIWWVD